MNPAPRIIALALFLGLALMALFCPETIRAQVKGSFTMGTGYLEHPRGLGEEPSAGYLSQTLRLASLFGSDGNRFRLGYEGDASQFGNETSLGSVRHGLGAEWFRNKPDGSQGLSAGVQGAVRSYADYYQIYDYQEWYSYFSLKKYLGRQKMIRGYLALRYRTFSDLPEESYLEPHGRLEYQHFTENRTTMGLAFSLGSKYYYDSIAPIIWGTSGTPSVSQFSGRMNLAKGLSDRLGLRGWVELRWNISDFPRYVADDVYDSPLLDSYAHEGYDAYLACKWLAPKQTWLELGASFGNHDYGSLLFASEAGAGLREDKVFKAGLSLSRTLPKDLGKPAFKLNGGWEHQQSTLSGYSFDGPYVTTSLSWQW